MIKRELHKPLTTKKHVHTLLGNQFMVYENSMEIQVHSQTLLQSDAYEAIQ